MPEGSARIELPNRDWLAHRFVAWVKRSLVFFAAYNRRRIAPLNTLDPYEPDSTSLPQRDSSAAITSNGASDQRHLDEIVSLHGLIRAAMNYVVALVVIVLATLFRIWLDPILGNGSPFATYTFAIVFMAWYGGVGPSIFAMCLGFLGAGYYFVHPRGSIAMYGLESQVGASLYVVVGISSILLNELMRKAQRTAEMHADLLFEKRSDLEREVKERREAQQAYADLLRRLVGIQEEERRRISRELHDQCGQELTALNLGLKSLYDGLQRQDDAQSRIRNLQGLVNSIAQEIHHLALELRPAALDELGLCSAVSNYAALWARRTGIAVDFEHQGFDDLRLPNRFETAIYRTLQEALNNAAKHTSSRRVSIILSRRESEVLAICEDQGPGFDVKGRAESAGFTQHLGLLGMRERIESVGGQLEIESSPDAGTTIYVRVPLV